MKRVVDGFHYLPKNEDSYYLVVHGGVIRALLVAFAPTEQPFWSYQVPHDKQFVLTFTRRLGRREHDACLYRRCL